MDLEQLVMTTASLLKAVWNPFVLDLDFLSLSVIRSRLPSFLFPRIERGQCYY